MSVAQRAISHLLSSALVLVYLQLLKGSWNEDPCLIGYFRYIPCRSARWNLSVEGLDLVICRVKICNRRRPEAKKRNHRPTGPQGGKVLVDSVGSENRKSTFDTFDERLRTTIAANNTCNPYLPPPPTSCNHLQSISMVVIMIHQLETRLKRGNEATTAGVGDGMEVLQVILSN